MIRFARDFRLIPIVLLATICLFALKVSGLVIDGGYTLAERLQNRNKADMQITTADSVPDYPKIVVTDRVIKPDATTSPRTPPRPWAQEMFSFNEAAKGELKVVIDRIFPLSEAAAAHAYIESRQAFGRVLLTP